jgi:hypothetical protein
MAADDDLEPRVSLRSRSRCATVVDLRNHVDRGFTEMRGKFDGTAAGLQQITQLLQTIVNDQPKP